LKHASFATLPSAANSRSSLLEREPEGNRRHEESVWLLRLGIGVPVLHHEGGHQHVGQHPLRLRLSGVGVEIESRALWLRLPVVTKLKSAGLAADSVEEKLNSLNETLPVPAPPLEEKLPELLAPKVKDATSMAWGMPSTVRDMLPARAEQEANAAQASATDADERFMADSLMSVFSRSPGAPAER
jgi:hypothetical protein